MRPVLAVLWPATILLTIVLFGAALWLGDVNQDEGWYLYAGRMVAEGRLPFIDFASTQGPVMSLVYAAAWPLVDRWGVAAGRVFTGLLGLGCIAASAGLAGRLRGMSERSGDPAPAGRNGLAGVAALLAVMFAGINVYQATFFTIVKTYALCGLFLALGMFVLTYAGGRRGLAAAVCSGVLLSLAASTRLSAAVAVPVVFLVLWFSGAFTGRGRAVAFAAGACVTGCLVVLPFALKAPTVFRFGLIDYHAARAVGGGFEVLAYKAGFTARVLRAYFVAVAVLLVGVVFAWRHAVEKRGRVPVRAWIHNAPYRTALWGSVIGISLLHLAATFPYDDYQVMVFPLFAAGLSAWAAAWAGRGIAGTRLLVLVFGLNVAGAAASPIVQDWFIAQQDRMWWPLKTQTPLERLRETGRLVRSLAGESDVLLTQDTYLAVEAGLRVPPGMELGPFSYYPEWDRARAEACHVLNESLLREVLRTTPADVAAFSGFSLAIAAPSVTPLAEEAREALWRLVRERYRPYVVVDDFGQARTRLHVLVRKP